jgi:predicted dehydrogenase
MFPRSLPTPTILDAQTAPVLRWGIIGPGGIARTFAQGVLGNTNQKLVAVASRDQTRAEHFAAAYGITEVFTDLRAMVASPNVDAVYVSTPHKFHYEHALAAIHAGKHVLVEKPFTTTAADARALVAAARDAGVFIMEAMWSKYLPQYDIVRQLVADGVLGDIIALNADHGQDIDHVERVTDPEGGGGLFDLGIYPIAFASTVFSETPTVTASGSLTASGVDAQAGLILDYPSGAQAVLSSTILAWTPTRASIGGTEAMLELHPGFYQPTGLTLTPQGVPGEALTWNDETGIGIELGLSYETTAFAHYLGEGQGESPLHSHNELVQNMDILDQARHQIGTFLPQERHRE